MAFMCSTERFVCCHFAPCCLTSPFCTFLCCRMSSVAWRMNKHNHGNSPDKRPALKQVITLKATCDCTKSSKILPISVSFYCFLNEPDTSVDSREYFRFAHCRLARLVSVADDADDFFLSLSVHDQRLTRVTCGISPEFTTANQLKLQT